MIEFFSSAFVFSLESTDASVKKLRKLPVLAEETQDVVVPDSLG